MSKANLIDDRRSRMIGYIKQGITADQIADIEGLDLVRARKERKRIADAEGLAIPPNSRAGFTPLGFAESNRVMRVYLGYALSDLLTKHDNDRITVAQLTGLTQAEQRAATKPSTGHNWTIAQIQRLADATGRTFEGMITYALNTSQIGFK